MNKIKLISLLRLACMLAALIFLALWNFAPAIEAVTQVEDRGDDKIVLQDGDTVTVSVTSSMDALSEIAVMLGGVKESKEMTLTLSLEGQSRIEPVEDPLAKASANSFRSLKTGSLPAGTYRMTVSASGQGSVSIKGVTDEDGAFHPTVRMKGQNEHKNIALLYMAGTWALLALIPVRERQKGAENG